ncbi:UNVERIFIED_CONTAM: hypothetical protein PYX00_011692 [Menopon gallinae]|uniref:ubiquitinyl hydrolase 1 n=1 Tax=Menopon gallinae TaxID=328185 RepID=A0AAW2H8A7_9NEOP
MLCHGGASTECGVSTREARQCLQHTFRARVPGTGSRIIPLKINNPQHKMEDLRISKFRENCAYCWRGLETQLTVCVCGLSLCEAHRGIHISTPEHTALYSVAGKEDISVSSTVLSEKECLRVKVGIFNLINSENRNESLLFETSKADCPHVSVSPKTALSAPGRRCSADACGVESNLWMCLSCGYTGCGRRQYGVEGNGHSLQHFEALGHPVSVFVESTGGDGSNDTFCYVCDTFVVNTQTRDMHQALAADTRSFFEVQSRAQRAIPSDGDVSDAEAALEHGEERRAGDRVGIENLGNTCYISSVMQMVADMVNVDCLEDHFACCEHPPLECLVCQTVRVLLSIRAKVYVPIVDFARAVFRNFPMFERNVQQDASEFFIYFVNQMKAAEAESKINKVTKVMDYELNNVIECECGLNRRRKEESFFLNIPFSGSVSRGLEEYFEAADYGCECGRVGKSLTYFRLLPEYLVIIVNRCRKDASKIRDELISDEIIVQNVLETVPSAEYTESLAGLGFIREEISNALVRSDNNADKACEIIIKSENFALRSKRSYKIHSAVCHTGESITSGHYTWIVKEDGQFVHVDDSKVLAGTEDILKRADLVVRGAGRGGAGAAECERLQHMYWDRAGSSFGAPGPGRIRLRPVLEDGQAYCSVSGRRIRRAVFAFPCGCVFDAHVLEFISELCPACNSPRECFVEARPMPSAPPGPHRRLWHMPHSVPGTDSQSNTQHSSRPHVEHLYHTPTQVARRSPHPLQLYVRSVDITVFWCSCAVPAPPPCVMNICASQQQM